jgi:hypothetical protein
MTKTIGRRCATEIFAGHPYLVMESPTEPPLGPRVRSELQEPHNELWLSPINTWEALLLHQKGRVYCPMIWTVGSQEPPLPSGKLLSPMKSLQRRVVFPYLIAIRRTASWPPQRECST